MSVEDHTANIIHYKARLADALIKMTWQLDADKVMLALFYGHELALRMGEDELRQWLDRWCKASPGERSKMWRGGGQWR